MKKNIWKRLLSLALALVLVAGVMPHFAVEAEAATSMTKDGYTVTVTSVTKPNTTITQLKLSYIYSISSSKESIIIDASYGFWDVSDINNMQRLQRATITIPNQDCTQQALAANGTGYSGAYTINIRVTREKQSTHTGGTPTCISGPLCAICKQEYGEPDPNAHTWGEWTTTDTTHSRTCTLDSTHTESGEHTTVGGREPTCDTLGKCGICGRVYGKLLPHSFSYEVHETDNTIDQECTECGLFASAYVTANSLTYNGQPQTGLTIGTVNRWTGDLPVVSATATNAGTYTGTMTYTKADGTTLSVSKNFVIAPYDISGDKVTVVLSDVSTQYNGQVQKPTYIVKFGDALMVEDTDYTVSWGVGDFTAPGEYQLVVTGVEGGNFKGTRSATYTIGKATPTKEMFVVQWPENLTYDGTTTFPVTLTSDVSGLGEITAVKYNGSEEAPINAGTYTVTVDVAANSNYNAATVELGSFTVAPTAGSIIIPANQSMTYDGAAVEYNDLNPTITTDGALTVKWYDSEGTEIDAPTNAGTYQIGISAAAGNNYEAVDEVKQTFTITKAPAVYTAPTAKELTYNGEAQKLLTEGEIKYNNNPFHYYINVEDPWQSEIPTATDAGTYKVTWAFLENENYLGATGKVDVTIAPATITVTPEAGQTMTYGDAVPALTYTNSGHIGSEVPAFTGTLGIGGTDAGTQQITQGTLKLADNGNFKASNYELTLAPAAMTVNRAPLTVNVQNQTVRQGQQIDQSKYEVLGLAAGDAAMVTLTASTDQVAVDGIIEAECVVRNGSGADVTDCYSIAYGCGELVVTPDTSRIDTLTEENVTSASEADIKAVLDQIAAGDEAAQTEFADVTEKCEKLLEKIDAVEKKNEELEQAAKSYDPATVNHEKQEEIQSLMKDLEEQMASENLTEAERSKLDLALENLEAAEKRIEDSLKALATEEIRDTLGVTAENVKPEQKQDIEKAIGTIEDALETHGTNYTDADKEDLNAQIEKLKAAQAVLEKAESVDKVLNALPKTADPDDEAALKAYADAKAAYDGLSEYEKSLVSRDAKQKLDGLYTALTNYKITKGNGGRWVDGSTKTLSFTANGPYSKFTGLKVDGKTVDPKDYTAAAGSTVITLKASYLDTLAVGKHTIRMEYTDGYVDGNFRVRSSAVPVTGDNGNLLLWTCLLFIGAASAAMLINQGRKKKW